MSENSANANSVRPPAVRADRERSMSDRHASRSLKEPSDLLVDVHFGTEMYSLIVAILGNRTAVTCNLRLQSASSRLHQRTLRSGPPRLLCISILSVSHMLAYAKGATEMTFSPIRSNCDEKCFANCKVIGRNLGIKEASQPERPIFQPNWTCLRWYELFLPIGGTQLSAAIGW